MALKNGGGAKSRREYKTRSYEDLSVEAATSSGQGNDGVEKEEL